MIKRGSKVNIIGGNEEIKEKYGNEVLQVVRISKRKGNTYYACNSNGDISKRVLLFTLDELAEVK